jgi:His-Xaa-Ser system radical SAM maturase HxsB
MMRELMTDAPMVFYPNARLKQASVEKVSATSTRHHSSTGALLPFNVRCLPDGSLVGVSESGDYAFFSQAELDALHADPANLALQRRAQLAARFFLPNHGRSTGMDRLLRARRAARRETVTSGPSLHIIVPTLQCGHSCQYCQVSRAQSDEGFSMTHADLDAACDRIWETSLDVLTVEFQGGDPLLRFDLIVRAVTRLTGFNRENRKRLRFVVATTLHQLTAEMCEFFAAHGVYLSTSVDGPASLHDKNRPVPGRNSHARTLEGIQLARHLIGADAVSALMTTTRASLELPEEIVDKYVRLGLQDIFLRPLSIYGFAKRNLDRVGYSLEEFQTFYRRALERILWWNRQGVKLREVYMSIILNKILSTFDAGYVDLQSPPGAGSSVLVYNYDGWVYPSDEARMLVESGDVSLRMGRISEPVGRLLGSDVRATLIQASQAAAADCDACAYRHYCAPNPVDSQAQFGRPDMPAHETEHCQRHLWLFDLAFAMIKNADGPTEELLYAWARPNVTEEATCAA